MIEKTAVLAAETTLFNSVLSGNLLRKSEDDISEIIKVYIQDAEVKNLMNVFNLNAGDFEIIYYHVFESLFFRDLLFVEDKPCLFATALILNLSSVVAIANRVYYNTKTSKDRHDCLVEAANFSAHAFFNEHAIRQNIVSVQYFCRNGIVQNLRQV